jgi:hypothetical protein
MSTKKILPVINPFLAYWADALTLLAEAVRAPDQAAACRLARSSSFHVLGGLHAFANSLVAEHLRAAADPEERGLLRGKFERILHANGIAATPVEDLALLIELDLLALTLNDPSAAQALDFPSDNNPRLIQFRRSPLKQINLEASGWVVEYAACVFALANRLLRRCALLHLGYERQVLEVVLGHHIHSEDHGEAVLEAARLEQLAAARAALEGAAGFLGNLAGPRWRLEAADFDVSFLMPPAR